MPHVKRNTEKSLEIAQNNMHRSHVMSSITWILICLKKKTKKTSCPKFWDPLWFGRLWSVSQLGHTKISNALSTKYTEIVEEGTKCFFCQHHLRVCVCECVHVCVRARVMCVHACVHESVCMHFPNNASSWKRWRSVAACKGNVDSST